MNFAFRIAGEDMRHRAGQSAMPPSQTTGIGATDQTDLAASGAGRAGFGGGLRWSLKVLGRCAAIPHPRWQDIGGENGHSLGHGFHLITHFGGGSGSFWGRVNGFGAGRSQMVMVNLPQWVTDAPRLERILHFGLQLTGEHAKKQIVKSGSDSVI